LLPGGPHPLLQGAYILIEDIGLCHPPESQSVTAPRINSDSLPNAQRREPRSTAVAQRTSVRP
jgi:hypothetical protein